MIRKTTPRALLGALLIAALCTQANAEVVGFGPGGHGKQKSHAPVVQLGGCALHAFCVPQSHWVPGYQKQVQQEVWIPAKQVQVWVAPIFEQRCGLFGVTYQVQVGGGYFTTQWQPGHMELVFQTVFVPGHFETSCQAVAAPHFQKPQTAPPAYGGLTKKGSRFGGYGPGAFGKKSKTKGYGG